MARAKYEMVAFEGEPDTIYIRDLDIGMSVTNDAENVVAELAKTHPGKRIVYQDTDGFWDELIHDVGRFIRFGTYKGPIPA